MAAIKILEATQVTRPLLSFEKSFCIKDCSLTFAIQKMPWHKDLLNELASLIPTKKDFLTVDILEQVFLEGDLNTCRDTSWHTDGNDNDYLIWVTGESRTMFFTGEPPLDLMQERDVAKRNHAISTMFGTDERLGIEIPEATPILYSSDNIHKGRIAQSGQKRLLIRLCMSDYLSPRNKILVRRLESETDVGS